MPESVFDAVNKALETGDVGNSSGNATPGPEANSDEEVPPVGKIGEETNTEDEGAEGEEGEEGAAEEAEEGEGEAEDGGEGGEKKGEQPESKQLDYKALTEEAKKLGIAERHANGQIKSAAELKTEIDAKAADGTKKPDAVSDPIPRDLKPETQERMRTLVKMTKELTTQRDEAVKNFDVFVNGLYQTGTTPQQYGEVLSFLSLFNSKDTGQQEKALELLESAADRLALLLGKERTVSDPLKDHADLRDHLAKGQITPKLAREIAQQRNSQAFKTQITAADRQNTEQQQQFEAEKNQARNDLTALEQTLRATDPQYDAKRAVLVPVLVPLFKTIPPSQWKAKFEEAYKAVKVATPRAKPVVPTNQPMRAGKSAGAGAGGKNSAGMASQPGSALDAINAALAGMGN